MNRTLTRTRRNDVRIALLGNLTARRQRALREIVRSQSLEHPWPLGSISKSLRINDRLRSAIHALPADDSVDALLEAWEGSGIRFLTDDDPDFPSLLREIPDSPTHIFVSQTGPPGASDSLGGVPADRMSSVEGVPVGRRSVRGVPECSESVDGASLAAVAIVGSRVASDSGRRLTRKLARDLAASGCVIVSGLARGIDGEAHEGALDVGGRTEAVLGTGLDVIYPPEHADLFQRIIRTGRVWTEFAPRTQPLPLHFPRRNRILVGLCQALVVVEGSERSGARSSVDHALDQGREVMAVPRDPSHPGAELPNRLLKEGARPVTSADDVLEAIRDSHVFPQVARATAGTIGAEPITDVAAETASRAAIVPNWPQAEVDPLQAALAAGAATLEELVDRCGGTSLPHLLRRLTEFELLGWAERGPDGRWRRGRA